MRRFRDLLAAALMAACVLPLVAGCKEKHGPTKPTVGAGDASVAAGR